MKRIYDVSKDTFMKCDEDDILIVSVPLTYSYHDMKQLVKTIKTEIHNQHIIVIPKDIDIDSLTFDELKTLKEIIESNMVAKKLDNRM